MTHHTFPIRNRVRITNYGPYRGLRGTIQMVDPISDDEEAPLCYYLIELEETASAQLIWFESQEVEFIDTPAIVLQPQTGPLSAGPVL